MYNRSLLTMLRHDTFLGSVITPKNYYRFRAYITKQVNFDANITKKFRADTYITKIANFDANILG